MRDEPTDEELDPFWIDGNDVIGAREEIRRLSKEEIVQAIDYEVDHEKTPTEQRRAKYERDKLIQKISGVKPLSAHHWKSALPKKKAKKKKRRS